MCFFSKLEESTNGEVLAPPSRHSVSADPSRRESTETGVPTRSQSLSSGTANDAAAAAGAIRARLADAKISEEVFGFES